MTEEEHDINFALNIILEENKKLNNTVNELKQSNAQLTSDFNEYKKNTDKILDGYYENFNRLFLMYEITPKGALKGTHVMCQELLNFVVNICNKYDLKYWLDFGNLLGCIRHDGFIPWDDDIDIGMMRKDFNVFLKVIKKEISDNGLEDLIRVTIDKKYRYKDRESIIPFMQIAYFTDRSHLLAGLDIFIYDYVKEEIEDMDKIFYAEKQKYHKVMLTETNREKALQPYYEKMGVCLEEEDYIIPAIENVRSKYSYKFMVYDKNDFFPLEKLSFNDTSYYCPKNYDSYLKTIYGDYHNIPKSLGKHQRVYNLMKDKHVEELFDTHIKKLQDVNMTYKSR